MAPGRFIAVVGPSGVGKDSVMRGLAEADARYALLRRVITRAPDAGGEDYIPVDAAQFLKMQQEAAFALSWQAHGLHYGVPVAVDQQLTQGLDVLANLSRGKLKEAQARFDRFAVLLLSAPRDVLARRLAERGRETADDIEHRLKRSQFALPDGLPVIEIENSGSLAETVLAAHSALQADNVVRINS